MILIVLLISFYVDCILLYNFGIFLSFPFVDMSYINDRFRLCFVGGAAL